MGKPKLRKKSCLLIAVLGVVVIAGLAIAGTFLMPLACSSRGERRLIGTWETETTGAPFGTSPSDGPPQSSANGGQRDTKAKVRDFFKHLSKAAQQWATTTAMRVTFERDRTYSESFGFGGRREVVNGHWKLVQGGDEQVIIQVYSDEANKAQSTELTIAFEGDDVMLYPGGIGQHVRMVRKKQE